MCQNTNTELKLLPKSWPLAPNVLDLVDEGVGGPGHLLLGGVSWIRNILMKQIMALNENYLTLDTSHGDGYIITSPELCLTPALTNQKPLLTAISQSEGV